MVKNYEKNDNETKKGNFIEHKDKEIIKYYDKKGKEIKNGDFIKHDDGDIEEVFFNGEDFGINASNKKFHENHPYSGIPEQIYPLHQFRMKEWEIIENKK